MRQYLPDIWELSAKFQPLAERLWGGPLVPLNEQAAVNINIVPPGGQQGFHKDRNEVTLLIYLTSNLGGELEYESDSPAGTQKIRTRAGTFVGLIKANEISHRVCPVQEMVVPFESERVALVISFGLPDINYADPSRDKFLYSTDPVENQKVF